MIVRDGLMDFGKKTFPAAGDANAIMPTPAALAATAYMLRRWRSDSEILMVLRDGEKRFTGHPLNVAHYPGVRIKNQRVISQVTYPGHSTTLRHLFALRSVRSKTRLRPDGSEPIRQRGVQGQVLAITPEPTTPMSWIYFCV